ncbi:hypothetical protein BLTE_06470 [Blastochloris tepida]|uniref:Uncharacterized protein n=1 Tax=Blastochloris tepida TaxID=2233851 RepID=A0A348FXC9_9HYPH|nr:hypothetical protein BLTE_06470 [Blastochloris tepida]
MRRGIAPGAAFLMRRHERDPPATGWLPAMAAARTDVAAGQDLRTPLVGPRSVRSGKPPPAPSGCRASAWYRQTRRAGRNSNSWDTKAKRFLVSGNIIIIHELYSGREAMRDVCLFPTKVST